MNIQQFKKKNNTRNENGVEIIDLKKLNQKEHDSLYNKLFSKTIFKKGEPKLHSVEYNPDTKIHSYIFKSSNGKIIITFKEKRNYVKKNIHINQ